MALTIPTASLYCLFNLPERDELVPKGGISESQKHGGLIWRTWRTQVWILPCDSSVNPLVQPS